MANDKKNSVFKGFMIVIITALITCIITTIVTYSFFIAKTGNYKSFKKTVLSYGVFCLWICANYFPVIITADSYRQDLLEGGYSAEYCDNLFSVINSKTIIILLILCFVFGCISTFIGKAVVKKHFEKAGIV